MYALYETLKKSYKWNEAINTTQKKPSPLRCIVLEVLPDVFQKGYIEKRQGFVLHLMHQDALF